MGIKSLTSNRRRGIIRHWITAGLDRYLESQKQISVPRTRFSPSGIGQCDLEIQLTMMGTKKRERTPEDYKVMDMGTFIGMKWYEYFRKMGILVDSEKTVQWNDPTIVGRIDCIIADPTGHDYLVEIKSRGANAGGITWGSFQKANINHTYQWQLYSLMTGIKQGCILVENRDDVKLDPKIFEMRFDQVLCGELLARMKSVLVAIGNNSLCKPPDVCPNTYCDYKGKSCQKP